jgi:hypothetical protein
MMPADQTNVETVNSDRKSAKKPVKKIAINAGVKNNNRILIVKNSSSEDGRRRIRCCNMSMMRRSPDIHDPDQTNT